MILILPHKFRFSTHYYSASYLIIYSTSFTSVATTDIRCFNLCQRANPPNLAFTITSLCRTPAERLSAILTRPGLFRHLSPTQTLKNGPDDFGAAAWLCTQVNGDGFQADVGTRAGFPAQNARDNGERGRSLLCAREALAKPLGAAVHLLTQLYPAFRKERRKFSTRRKFSGCRAKPDQEDLACRRYSKDTSCPAVLSPAQDDGNDITFRPFSKDTEQQN